MFGKSIIAMSEPAFNSFPQQSLSCIERPSHLDGYAPLGAIAVSSAEGRLWNEMLGSYYEDTAKERAGSDESEAAEYHLLGQMAKDIAEGNGENTRTMLLQVRNRLLRLDEKDRRTLDIYLGEHLPDTFRLLQTGAELREAAAAEGGEEEVSHEPNYVSWLATAPNGQLLNFLQWHNDRIERINADPAVQERLQEERLQYAELVRQAVKEGDLPEGVLSRLDKVTTVPTFIGDTFDMAMHERAGYYRLADKIIVLEESYEPISHFHELSHAILGKMASHIFNEAMTEHISLSLMNGNFHLVNPYFRQDQGVYEPFRNMVGSVLTSGVADITRFATAAYCANDTDSLEYELFQEKLLAAYKGLPIMDFINDQMIEAYELISSGEKTHGTQPEEYAVAHAAQGVKYLGSILRGRTDDMILAPSIRVRKTLRASLGNTKKIDHSIDERRRRIAQIRHYVSDNLVAA